MFTRPISRITPGLTMMLLLMALHVGALSSAAAADFDKGVAAYEAGDYQTALTEWRPPAEAGDAEAQFNLAVMYDNGEGVPQDYLMTHIWYDLSASHGNELGVKNRN